MPSDEPSRPYNWRLKSLAKLKLRQSKDIEIFRYPSIFSILNVMIVRFKGIFLVLSQYLDYSSKIRSKDCHCTLHFHA